MSQPQPFFNETSFNIMKKFLMEEILLLSFACIIPKEIDNYMYRFMDTINNVPSYMEQIKQLGSEKFIELEVKKRINFLHDNKNDLSIYLLTLKNRYDNPATVVADGSYLDSFENLFMSEILLPANFRCRLDFLGGASARMNDMLREIIDHV
jgi:hypothetical protein